MRKQVIKFLSHLSPKVVTNLAYKTMVTPQIQKLRPHEMVMLDKAEQTTIQFAGFDIQLYEWGKENDKRILLIHGWEGQAGNFTDLIPKLVEEGYHVIAFDAPSHGFSSKGKTSLFEFSDLVGEMIERYDCEYLVSHSFGGVATTYALYNNQNLKIKKYVLLTTPDKLTQRIDSVAEMVGITSKVKRMLTKRLENEMAIEVKDANVSSFVKKVNVNQSLIIHDKNDRVIPLFQSKNVYENWENCAFKEIEGTGHFRILRTESVLDDVVEFLN